MAILASGHKLVRCGIDGAISGVVTDETLSGNGTSGKPLGALLEDVLFDDSITESSTDFGTLIGVNPLWVNYVVTGGGSSGGNPQVNYIVNTYSGAWNDTTDVVQSNSSNWDNVTNKLDTTSFSTVSGNFLTAVDLTPYYTTADANTLSSMFSGAIDYVSANAGIDFPASADNAVQYVQSTSGIINETTNVVQSNSAQWAEGGTGDVEVNSFVYDNSATINEVNTTFQNNSGNYLTAHQDISNKLDTNSFTAWSAAQAANAFKLSAGNGINLIDDSINKITRIDVTAGAGDVEVNTYVRNNSAGINNAVSTYQSNSANYLTAHQDISNKLDITAFRSWTATQEANDYELSAGNGVTLYDDAVNKITRIDVTATGGDEEVNTLVHSNSSTWNDVTNKLDKSESANYYPRTGNPSKFIPQSALNLKIDKISGIGGSAFSVGNHNAVTFPLSDGFGGIDIGIPYDNGYLKYLCTDHISEVTLTTMPKAGKYKISANSAEYIIPGNSWITFYEQRNSEGQYRWTIKDYNGSGVLTSATSTTTGGGVPQSAFDELKQSYDALSALVATYSAQWLSPNEGV